MPGTQTCLEDARTDKAAARAKFLDSVLTETEERHELNAKMKFRHAKAQNVVSGEAKVRAILRATSACINPSTPTVP